jgi:phosphoribosylamine-glycine ligase
MLFTGFMLTPNGPKVLEYNVRFGDPETEALMLLLSEDTDLAAVLLVSRLLAPETPLPQHIGIGVRGAPAGLS